MAAPPGSRRAALGQRGEQLAGAYLERAGYRILERNWRGRVGELDLVVERDDGALVFVEVRTLTDADFDDPLASIGPRKMRQVARVAEEYLLHHPRLRDAEMRFDVVGVTLPSGPAEPRIDHIEDAFGLPEGA